MNTIWTLYEHYTNTIWTQYEHYMNTIWIIYARTGLHACGDCRWTYSRYIHTTWTLCEPYVNTICTPYEYYGSTIWGCSERLVCRHYMNTRRDEDYMNTVWTLYEHYIRLLWKTRMPTHGLRHSSTVCQCHSTRRLVLLPMKLLWSTYRVHIEFI